MRAQREKIFNLPAVVLAAVVLLVGIHVLRGFLPLESNLALLREFGFVPGRFTYAFDPHPVVVALDAARQKSEFDGEIAGYFLGNGKPLWWTPLTYAFLHASYLHVGFNCLWLVAFGAPVARRFGTPRFLMFCVATAIAGALAHYVTHLVDLQPVIGASAVVSGTMAAALRFVFQPGAPLGEGPDGLSLNATDAAYRQPALPLRSIITDRRAMTFLIAWFFANMLFGLVPSLSGLTGATIAWQAHIGGFLVGLFAFPLFDPPAPIPSWDDPQSD
ncbi:rhomboid family intramembrane serine protease [Methylovirgula sp. HY1]|uniref:rhomboid family intramembrane serine protease n=1 Tax=Methylovirgula sp. HY1 TaxID=2822761 RepID=UPI001C5A63BE|nr:rhomboid family intramembrane serine protease [Methylovirgula sp. HY1]QXX73718.1 Rhomboid protease GlpG [Methylovirgula sp. HY1]